MQHDETNGRANHNQQSHDVVHAKPVASTAAEGCYRNDERQHRKLTGLNLNKPEVVPTLCTQRRRSQYEDTRQRTQATQIGRCRDYLEVVIINTRKKGHGNNANNHKTKLALRVVVGIESTHHELRPCR